MARGDRPREGFVVDYIRTTVHRYGLPGIHLHACSAHYLDGTDLRAVLPAPAPQLIDRDAANPELLRNRVRLLVGPRHLVQHDDAGAIPGGCRERDDDRLGAAGWRGRDEMSDLADHARSSR